MDVPRKVLYRRWWCVGHNGHLLSHCGNHGPRRYWIPCRLCIWVFSNRQHSAEFFEKAHRFIMTRLARRPPSPKDMWSWISLQHNWFMLLFRFRQRKKKKSITLCCLDRSTRAVIDMKKNPRVGWWKSVLLSILLRGKASIVQWKSRLSSAIPKAVADIKVEAAFNSNSHSAYLRYQLLCGTCPRMVRHTSLWLLWNLATSSALALALILNMPAFPESLAGNIHLSKGKNDNIK